MADSQNNTAGDAANRLQEDSAMPPALSTVPTAMPAVPPESLAPNQSALAQTQQLNDMLQKVNANAEQVMRAAEKTLYAAEILADTAHTIENHKKLGESEPDTENQVPQNPPADTKSPQGDSPTAEASRGNEELLEQIAKMLPVIRRLLENKDTASKYEHEIMLFKRLRALGEHLPESKRDVFLSGKTRLLLDYLVARLSGKPGLLRMVKALRETDALGGGIDKTAGECSGIAGRELTRKVLGDLCALLPSLEDQTLAAALQSEWQTVERKL